MKETQRCLIRTATLEDTESTLTIQKSIIAEGDYFISVSDEFTKTVEEHRKWIKETLESESETFLVAEKAGEVIGWLVFKSNTRKRLAHTGTFGIMIKQDFRNQGIGKLLISTLLEWAEKNPIIEKVSLGVFSTNERAIGLYKSLGFIEEGRKVKEFKISEKEYIDDILMYKLVK